MKVDLNEIDKEGWTPLTKACYFDEFSTVVSLLENPEVDINKPNKKGDTPLVLASRGRLGIVRELLKYNNDSLKIIELVNSAQNSERFYVKKLENGSTKKLDLKELAINKSGSCDDTALMVASEIGDVEIVKELLKCKNLEINKRDIAGYTAIHTAVCEQELPVVIELLKCEGIDIYIPDSDGGTLLSLATYDTNKKEILKELNRYIESKTK